MEWVKHDSIWPPGQNLPAKIVYVGLFKTEQMIHAMKVFLSFVFGLSSAHPPSFQAKHPVRPRVPKISSFQTTNIRVISSLLSPEVHASSLLQSVHYSPLCSSASAVPHCIQPQADHTWVSSILHRCSFRLMYLFEQRNAIHLDSRVRWTEHAHEALLFIPLTHLPPGVFVVWGWNKGICIPKWE